MELAAINMLRQCKIASAVIIDPGKVMGVQRDCILWRLPVFCRITDRKKKPAATKQTSGIFIVRLPG